MNTEALSYSRTKGLFAGVAVDGAKIQQDNDSTVAIYGKNVSFRKTLSGDVHAPASSDSFLAAVNAAVRKANVARNCRSEIVDSSPVCLLEWRHAGSLKVAALSGEVPRAGAPNLDSAAMLHQPPEL